MLMRKCPSPLVNPLKWLGILNPILPATILYNLGAFFFFLDIKKFATPPTPSPPSQPNHQFIFTYDAMSLLERNKLSNFINVQKASIVLFRTILLHDHDPNVSKAVNLITFYFHHQHCFLSRFKKWINKHDEYLEFFFLNWHLDMENSKR